MNPNSNFQVYQGLDDMLCMPHGIETCSNNLTYTVSTLRDKIHQLEIFVSAILSSRQQSNVVAISNAESTAHEIITAASSTIHALQQINLDSIYPPNKNIGNNLYTIDDHHHYSGNPINNEDHHEASDSKTTPTQIPLNMEESHDDNIVELDAEALLAKFTHYCQVCGKGFKRDANLRMHMRAHGDEYKTKLALTNLTKPSQPSSSPRYSCPQEGCRWNKGHPRFTPLKSMVCVKNHYKRSHCAKMYVCKRCNQKNFSVLSDLRTHEKHCGELRWRCSCGTFFSRKDKLMGHVALFVGHQPV